MALVLFVLLLVGLFMELGRRDTIHTMENISLLSAQETWLRQVGYPNIPREPYAWLIPSHNGEPRVHKPPLLVWLTMLSFTGLDPQTATVEEITVRARMVSVLLGVLMVLATAWLGCVLADRPTAVLAAAVVGSTWFLQRQARYASYDIYLAAFATAAVAAGVWAIDPLRRAPGERRRVIGWLLCALMFTCATLSKGPLSLLLVLLPLVVAIGLAPRPRHVHVWGLLGATLLMLVLCEPWFVISIIYNARGAEGLAVEYVARRAEFQPVYYYLGTLGLVWPWTAFLIGGLLHPFLLAGGARRRELLFAWLWFVALIVIMSIPAAKQQRYILPVLPAVGLMVAALWRDYQRLEDRQQRDPAEWMLLWPHWVGIVGGSVAVGVVIFANDQLKEALKSSHDLLGKLDPIMVVLATVVLLALALLGVRAQRQRRMLAAAQWSAVWALVLLMVIQLAYSRSDNAIHPLKAECLRAAQLVGNAPLRYLKLSNEDLRPNEEFLFFARRIVPAIQPEELHEYRDSAPSAGPVYVMSDISPAHDATMEAAGFKLDGEFVQDVNRPQKLWVHRLVAQSPMP